MPRARPRWGYDQRSRSGIVMESALRVPDTKTLAGVQYLRGIAATMVAYFHMIGQVPSLSPYIEKFLLGRESLASGVDVFFVISGFIMLLTTQKTEPMNFIIRRIIRVVPLYWLLSFTIVAIALWRPNLFRTTQIDVKSVILSLLFIPYQNAGHQGDVVPILVPGWSLNFEMFFYAIFAIVLLCKSLSRRVLINGVVFLALIALHYSGPGRHSPELAFLTNLRIAEFWLGMLIAQLYVKRAFVGQRAAVWWAILAAAFAVLVFHPAASVFDREEVEALLFTMLPAGVIVLSVAALEQLRAVPKISFLVRLGDASYSIYLSHILVLGLCRSLWEHFGMPDRSLTAAASFAVFSTVTVVYGGFLVYWGVERPMTDFLHRAYRRRFAAPLPVAI
jgi:exopolysaccharide production protein ExoZ